MLPCSMVSFRGITSKLTPKISARRHRRSFTKTERASFNVQEYVLAKTIRTEKSKCTIILYEVIYTSFKQLKQAIEDGDTLATIILELTQNLVVVLLVSRTDNRIKIPTRFLRSVFGLIFGPHYNLVFPTFLVIRQNKTS